jgi:hypothetical protein
MNRDTIFRLIFSVVLAVMAGLTGLLYLDQQAGAQNTPCYGEQGGAKFCVSSYDNS